MSLLLLAIVATLILTDRLISVTVRSALPWFLSPVTWMLVPWMLCATLFALPIIIHRETLTVEHVGYVSMCLGAYCIGVWMHLFLGGESAFSRRAPATARIPSWKTSNWKLTAMAALGLLGSALTLYDNIAITGISFIERIFGTGLAAARELNFASQVQEIHGPYHLLEPLSGFGVLYILCYLQMRFSGTLPLEKARQFFWLAVTTAAAAAVTSLLVSGGRMAIVLFVLVFTQAILLDPNKVAINWLRARSGAGRIFLITTTVAVSVIVVGLLGTVYVQKRSNQISPITSLYISHRASVEDWVYSTVREVPLVGYGVFTLSYLTTPLATLTLYIDLPENRMPGPFFGQYNFPGIADRIVKRIDEKSLRKWWDARLEIFSPMMSQGFGGNVWATLFRDIAADVTFKFVPVVTFLLGIFSAIAVRNARTGADPFWVAIACAMLSISAFSVFHSIIYIGTISSLLFLGFGAILIGRFSNLLAIAKPRAAVPPVDAAPVRQF